MARFQVAHFQEQGQQVIAVFVDWTFGAKGSNEQSDIYDAIQLCASSAGLAGTVMLVWQSGGRMSFYGPERWSPFFRTIGWNNLVVNINRELTCDF